MAQNDSNLIPSWLIHLNKVDSSNNYAMQLISDGLAQEGMVVWADHQTQGKGQRGNVWQDEAGKNLAFSLIIRPDLPLNRQFDLNIIVATTITAYLKSIYSDWKVSIKWPNDIYINDKKAVGILTENTLRGMNWQFAVIGIGINVNQEIFDNQLVRATSLKIESGHSYELSNIITQLRIDLLKTFEHYTFESLFEYYQAHLFKKDQIVTFRDRSTQVITTGIVKSVTESGNLVIITDNKEIQFTFGSVDWLL